MKKLITIIIIINFLMSEFKIDIGKNVRIELKVNNDFISFSKYYEPEPPVFLYVIQINLFLDQILTKID